ncbi:MAG: ABC transporter permease [Candidatus Sumerlaeota bacterium]|nr:ABC transporter permease [Candidatus Sumerlaeota bacterium]
MVSIVRRDSSFCRFALALAPGAVALAVGLAAGAAVLVGFGVHPLRAYFDIINESFGSAYGLGQLLQKVSQLTLSGLAVALAFRAGLFNIGGEGQIVVGSLAGAAVGLAGARWPAPLLLSAAIVACALGGALWGAIPGALKAVTGAHEVIVTIMMNFIAYGLAQWLLTVPGFGSANPVHTAPIGPGAAIARLSETWGVFAGSTANWSFLLAAGALLAYWALLRHSRFGFEVRVLGDDPLAARYGAVPVGAILTGAMALSGAFAGLIGADVVLGTQHYFESGYTAGLGFQGIAVALFGGARAGGVLAGALIFAVLLNGKVALAGQAPPYLLDVLAAVILLATVSLAALASRSALLKRHLE